MSNIISSLGKYVASLVKFTPTSNLTSTNVQDAITELDNKKLSMAVRPYTIEHNDNGFIETVTVGDMTYTMTYDSLNRLDTVSDGTTTIQCQYNDYGQFTGTVTV